MVCGLNRFYHPTHYPVPLRDWTDLGSTRRFLAPHVAIDIWDNIEFYHLTLQLFHHQYVKRYRSFLINFVPKACRLPWKFMRVGGSHCKRSYHLTSIIRYFEDNYLSFINLILNRILQCSYPKENLLYPLSTSSSSFKS